MELTRLRLQNLRLFEHLELELTPGWNLFQGANGAGKTSLLEAVYLLSHGRSFRTASNESLVRHGTSGYSVYGELKRGAESIERVGVARGGSRLEARLNGSPLNVADLLRHTAVLCFEPGSHALIGGASEERRRYLDWGVFHVEHSFMRYWRGYQRVLKQRNAVLRGGGAYAELDVWDEELVAAAQPLTTARADYFVKLKPLIVKLLQELVGELGDPNLRLHPGHDENDTLMGVLRDRRVRDYARGHTSAGPHRADWSLSFNPVMRREHLSRGQEKLAALACTLAQARLHAQTDGEWPILCFDDLPAEIDTSHQRKVLASLPVRETQVLATSTTDSELFEHLKASSTRFHVEQGIVSRLI